MKTTRTLTMLATFFCMLGCQKADEVVGVDARSGATPVALARAVPSNLTLTVNGEVEQEYRFGSGDLSALAATRIRTRKVSGEGEYLGAYAYAALPVIHILEGVAPHKKEDADFNRPLDMMVTATASEGKTTRFSYNEICMADDALP